MWNSSDRPAPTEAPEGPRLALCAVGGPAAGDDAVALELLERLERLPLDPRLHRENWGRSDALDMTQRLLELELPVLVVDCAEYGAAPGEGRLLAGDSIRLGGYRDGLSCHGFGVAEALALARQLGRSAPVDFFAIQPFDLTPGTPLSAPMRERLGGLLEGLQAAVERLLREGAAPPAPPPCRSQGAPPP